MGRSTVQGKIDGVLMGAKLIEGSTVQGKIDGALMGAKLIESEINRGRN